VDGQELSDRPGLSRRRHVARAVLRVRLAAAVGEVDQRSSAPAAPRTATSRPIRETRTCSTPARTPMAAAS
jgi:hypothetical protein